jgi:hypothetical protein
MVKKNNLLLASLSILVLLSLFCKKGPGEENYLEPINVSNNPARSIEPSIAVDSKGTVHLVWTDYTPGEEQIFTLLSLKAMFGQFPLMSLIPIKVQGVHP